MKNWLLYILFFAFASTIKAQTIAISYFDNSSGDVKYNALSKGIADMLITDLSKIKGFTIVEREKFEKLNKEIKQGLLKYYDSATAQKFGKGLGAEKILTGSFYLLDNTILMDVRLIDVETGGITAAEEITGNKNNFFVLHQQLANLLSKSLNIAYSPDLSGLYKSNDAVEVAAVVNYSNAIQLQDQGMSADAELLLEKMIKSYPNFNFAKNKLDELKEWMIQVEHQKEIVIGEELKNIVSSLDTTSDKFGTQISNVWTTLLSSYKYNHMLWFNNSLRKMKVNPNKKMYGEYSPYTVGEMIMYYDCIALNALKKQDEIVESSKAFITAYPTSIYVESIKMYLAQAIKELEQHENGKIGLEVKLAAEALDVYLNYLNRLRLKSNLQFVDEKEYRHYKQLYKSQVLNATKEMIDVWNDTPKFNEFTGFFDVAFYFNDIKLMEEIVKNSKKLFIGSNDEKEIVSLENKLKDYKSKIDENKQKVIELERIANKGTKEELERIIKLLFDNEKYNRPDLFVNICDQYITNFKVGSEDENEILLKAWEGFIVNAAKLKSIDEAKKNYETLKGKANDFKDNRAVYEKSSQEISANLISLENDYNGCMKTIKNNDPMEAILENYAKIYQENYQYSDEAFTRKQLIDLFKLDDEKGALQLFLLSMSYFNLGYFDNVKKTAVILKQKYPSSKYSDSISSIANFMPR